jgi:hypothetical protein
MKPTTVILNARGDQFHLQVARAKHRSSIALEIVDTIPGHFDVSSGGSRRRQHSFYTPDEIAQIVSAWDLIPPSLPTASAIGVDK